MCQIIELPEDGPTCPHGIMLKIVNKSSESFHYACSAFRGKDECKRQELCRKNTLNNWSVENILSSDQSNRAYCSTCDCLFSMVTERKKHKMHEYRGDLSDNLLTMPSYLLKPLGDSKAHAQYFFSLNCLNQLYSIINNLSVNYVVCIGSPRLHDFIQLQFVHRGQLTNSYLLDIDFRLTNFYRSHNFSQYNMVNGFFFSQQDKENFYNFIKENVKSMHKCLIFCDPPFAAPLSLIIKQIKVLQNSVIRCINQNAGVSKMKKSDDSNKNAENTYAYLMALPYFFEKKLQKIAPFINMLDYKMTYENHSRLDCDRNNPDISQSNTINNENQANRGKRRDSVVRLFTNLSPSLVHPPESLESSFRFCEICQRYSHITNVHCLKCNRCTTKNGPTYVHCDKCGRCRSSKKFHCNYCERCVSVDQCVHQSKRPKLLK